MHAQGVVGSSQLASITVVCFDAPASVGVCYAAIIESLRFKVNPISRDVVKSKSKSKSEDDTKNIHEHQSRPQMMPNRSLLLSA